MITKKYAIIALLGMASLLLVVPTMANAVKTTWLGEDCTTLKAGMVPICFDLNFLMDLHITPLESDVTSLETEVEEMYEMIEEQVEHTFPVTILVDSNDPECEANPFRNFGWCPMDMTSVANIEDPLVTESSFIMVNYKSPIGDFSEIVCLVNGVHDGWFSVTCTTGVIENGSELHYIIIQ